MQPIQIRRRAKRAPGSLVSLGAVILGTAVLAGGCGFLGPRPDPSRFYVLTATADAGSARFPESVGVGPITMPDYLKRGTIVTRTLPNEITPSAIDRWGEPVDRAVPRILQENLRRLLATDQVVIYPWYARPNRQVAIDLLSFERDLHGEVVLVARWEIRNPENAAVLRTGETRATRAPALPGTSASVAAQSDALAELSREIASALRATGVSGRGR